MTHDNVTDIVERLQKREHHFRHASEGEYDANLLMKARHAITELTTLRKQLENARSEELVCAPIKIRALIDQP